MGQTSSSDVRSLPSLDIERDTDILLRVFHGKLEVEKVPSTTGAPNGIHPQTKNEQRYNVLWNSTERFVVLLVQSRGNADAVPLPKTWAADESFIQKVLSMKDVTTSPNLVIQAETIQDKTIALVTLSVATIFLLPSSIVDTASGRTALAQKICQFTQGSIIPTSTTKTNYRTKDDSASSARSTSVDSTNSSLAGPDTSVAQAATATRSSAITNPPPAKLSTNRAPQSSPLKSPKGRLDELKRTPPKFPSLDVKLLQSSGVHDKPLQLNTIEAQDFETDLFKGKVLMLMKPTNPEDDPYWTEHMFSKKKRIFLLQLQGKFKRQPQGQLYVGGEITKPIRVGLLTRGIMGGLLRFVETFFSDVVHSFGDDKNDGGKEDLPRVVIPAHWAVSSLETTPEGQTPPPITGEPFHESDAERKKRAKAKTWDWNTTDTYSISFFSMYFNFVEWKIVNVPISKGINLSTMWGDAAMRVVFYENVGSEKKHMQKDNRYYFSVQVKHTPGVTNEDASEANEESDIQDALDLSRRTNELLDRHAVVKRSGLVQTESMSVFPDFSNKDDSDSDEFYFDATETLLDQNAAFAEPSYQISKVVEMSLAKIDATVPGWVDMLAGARGGCMKYYGINANGKKTVFLSKTDCDSYLEKSGLREEANAFVTNSFSYRLSASEKKRRMLAYVVSNEAKSSASLFAKLVPANDEDDGFLRRSNPPEPSSVGSDVLLSGLVARAISDQHWAEELACIDKSAMITFRQKDKKRSTFRIGAQSIVSVEVLPGKACPMFIGYSFLCIESIGRSIYLMFLAPLERDAWVSTIQDLAKRSIGQENDEILSRDPADVDSPAQEFMHNSTVWDCKKRRIYNCAMFAFHAADELKRLSEDPLTLVKRALRLAVDAVNNESITKQHYFLKCVALFKTVEVHSLSEKERLAFFLNLYHTMLMHAFLILGPPSTSLKFIHLFKDVAYQLGDEIMSLAQLEHCVIRSAMSSPAAFLSRFVIPKSNYRYALQQPDFRINFALNCGSKSNPPGIYVYTPETLEEQLDAAARLFLDNVSVSLQSSRDLVITLPRVCQWFSQDFGKPEDLISEIVPYLKAADQQKLLPFAQFEKKTYDMTGISIRFEDFSFSCRPLALL